jgi:hypothetical protein
MSRLAHRLEDIPGVESVVVDLSDEGGGINVKLSPGADEMAVMDRLRTVLISYGVRSQKPLPVESLPEPRNLESSSLGVGVRITPLERGARVEVETKSVRSFRLVSRDRLAIAQGLADAWSQVVGRVPTELISASLDDDVITVVARRDGVDVTGQASITSGWQMALALAVGRAIGTVTD